MNKIQTILANKHTSYAGAAVFACEVFAIWFPDYKDQLDATQGLLMAYGLLLAGDSKQHETKVTITANPPRTDDTPTAH
jgi:hypothetical protein